MTVTGVTLPSASKIWLMPTFLPIIPFMEPPVGLLWNAQLGSALHIIPVHTKCHLYLPRCPARPTRLYLDFDVHTGGQIQPHQGVNRLAIRVQDINQPLMSPNLEMLLRILINERRTLHSKTFDPCGQRHGADHTGTSSFGSLHDALRRLVQY